MNDKNINAVEEDNAMAQQAATPGQILATARQSLGLSANDIAKKLNLSVRVIKEIEADQYEHFSAPIYLRGYLRSYARHVSVSEEKVLDAVASLGFSENSSRELSQRAMQKTNGKLSILVSTKPTRRKHRILPWATLVICAVLIGLVVLWWQDQNKADFITLPKEAALTNFSTRHAAKQIEKKTNAASRKISQQTSTRQLANHKNKLSQAHQESIKKILHKRMTTAKVAPSTHANSKKRTSALTPDYTLEPVQN